jgi:hypothetical protein
MAVSQDRTMRCSSVIADNFVDPMVTVDQLKSIGSLWGSWRTWRAWNTDNVLCNDLDQATQLLQRNFQQSCNFYLPNKHYADVGRPTDVRLYNGDFPGELDRAEEIIAMHLVAENNDLVLLFGYNLTMPDFSDKMQQHKSINYLNAFRATINTYPSTQWVIIDHLGDLEQSLQQISNLTCDKFKTVLQLFN